MKLAVNAIGQNMYPKVDIVSLNLTLDAGSFSIHSHGDLPLYKTHQFENGLQEYIEQTI